MTLVAEVALSESYRKARSRPIELRCTTKKIATLDRSPMSSELIEILVVLVADPMFQGNG